MSTKLGGKSGCFDLDPVISARVSIDSGHVGRLVAQESLRIRALVGIEPGSQGADFVEGWRCFAFRPKIERLKTTQPGIPNRYRTPLALPTAPPAPGPDRPPASVTVDNAALPQKRKPAEWRAVFRMQV